MIGLVITLWIFFIILLVVYLYLLGELMVSTTYLEEFRYKKDLRRIEVKRVEEYLLRKKLALKLLRAVSIIGGITLCLIIIFGNL